MVKANLVVTSFKLTGGEGRGLMGSTPPDYVLRDSDVRSSGMISLPDDGIECKVLRGKTLVLEWGITDIRGGMHTTRTKFELGVSACGNPRLSGGELSLELKEPPRVYSGSQPFDRAKRQKGKTTWSEYSGGTLYDGRIFDLFSAVMQSSTLTVALKNADAKIRKELAALLDPAGAEKGAEKPGTPLTSGKRDRSEMDLGQMSAAQINKMLRQMQVAPHPSLAHSTFRSELPAAPPMYCCT